MTNVEKKLREIGVELGECPVPVAAYVPVQIAGNLVFVSGNTSVVEGKLQYSGKVGKDISVEEAYQSARICAIRCLSGLRAAVNLDRIRIVQVSGYINAVPEFTQHPEVVNGASELLEAVFGEKGKHARKAIGSGSLPGGASVEIEMIALLEDS